MNPIDLYQLTRIEDLDAFTLFERKLSNRKDRIRIKSHEKDSLIVLVDSLVSQKIDAGDLKSFYYSFEIPQIGKEFDLLRINDDSILNIELKSRDVGSERIGRQLLQNMQYLSHLSRKMVFFTFIASTKKFYQLDTSGAVIEVTADTVIQHISAQTDCISCDINSFFRVSDFLVSPLNTPNKFINKEYFLTPQQQIINSDIMNTIQIASKRPLYFGITGGPGTGKTLALYDLAHDCSKVSNTCIIHCGILSDGHHQLDREIPNLNVFPASRSMLIDFTEYEYVFVDESHRFYPNQFDALISAINQNKTICIFSYDKSQVLSRKEAARDMATKMTLLPNFKEYKLTNKVRTNKEIASFIRRLLDINHTDIQPHYPSISVAYANDKAEADFLIREYRSRGFVFINYTQSQYYTGPFDMYDSDTDTHHVIGQEYNDVLMLIDDTFRYDEKGKLVAKYHPNPDYIYRQLLFQGLTRVREKLAIIVLNNLEVFKKMLIILDS